MPLWLLSVGLKRFKTKFNFQFKHENSRQTRTWTAKTIVLLLSGLKDSNPV